MNILYKRLLELILAPLYSLKNEVLVFDPNLDMLFLLVPVVLSIVFSELYFGRYKQEKLGWNSAFTNSLILVFVSFNLLGRLYVSGGLEYLDFKNLLALGIFFEGFTLTLVSFFHLIPEDYAFKMYSSLPVNFIAYIGIILIYSDIPLDITTCISALGILIILAFILKVLNVLEPGVEES